MQMSKNSRSKSQDSPNKNKLGTRLAGKSETSPSYWTKHFAPTVHSRNGAAGVRIPGSGHSGQECLLRLYRREGFIESGDQPSHRVPYRFCRQSSANLTAEDARTKGRLGAGATLLTQQHVLYYSPLFRRRMGTVQN